MLFPSTRFKKRFDALSQKIQAQIEIRLDAFVADQFDPLLNDHSLHGEYEGCRSINITGDMRLVYKKMDADKYLLVIVGTHHQLFGK